MGLLRILFVVILAGVVYFIYKQARGTDMRCPKCFGKGYWRGTRPDDREKCDECFGTGRVPRY